MTLNVPIPEFPVFVRAEFLHGMARQYVGDFEAGMAVAVATIPGRCLCFWVLLDNGALIGRLPIHALVTKRTAPQVPADQPWRVQLWDCFAYGAAVVEFPYLQDCRVRVALADRSQVPGSYRFTVDYYGAAAAENAGDAGWKCHHVLELDDGRLAAQPNNRVCWFEPSRVRPFAGDDPPKYLTIDQVWRCEDGDKWRGEDSPRMFYDVKMSTTS